MKIKVVESYLCDSPSCENSFEISTQKGSKTLHIDAGRVVTSLTEYRNANGMTFCPGCTSLLLKIIGSR